MAAVEPQITKCRMADNQILMTYVPWYPKNIASKNPQGGGRGVTVGPRSKWPILGQHVG